MFQLNCLIIWKNINKQGRKNYIDANHATEGRTETCKVRVDVGEEMQLNKTIVKGSKAIDNLFYLPTKKDFRNKKVDVKED